MRSIRTHLAASAPYDGRETQIKTNPCISVSKEAVNSVVQLFKQNVELVDGRCIVVRDQTEVDGVIIRIAQEKGIFRKGIVSSNDAIRARDLFKVDVGITNAQAGIAETGTLVLDSSVERNRLVSLVPPVHIAIINASRIYATLGEALAVLQSGEEISPAITFITGPSRTGDIEMTLTVGVHGPRELYVIVIEGST